MNKMDHLTSLLLSLVLVFWGVAVREFWRNPQYHSSERRPTYEMSNIPKPTLPKTKQKKHCIWMNFSRCWYRIVSVTYVNMKLQILTGLFIFKGYLEWNNILIFSEKYSSLCRVIASLHPARVWHNVWAAIIAMICFCLPLHHGFSTFFSTN